MNLLTNTTQEEWFDIWANELKDKGYIIAIHNQENCTTFSLFEGLYQVKTIQTKVLNKKTNKTQLKIINSHNTLLHPVTYTPDRLIIWDKKAKDLFFTLENSFKECYFIGHEVNGGYYSTLDIKAPPGYGGNNSSDQGFAVKQKWMWEKYKIYINKVYNYPNKSVKVGKIYLWLTTFTPARFFKTDKLTKDRTISKWTPRTLEEFLEK